MIKIINIDNVAEWDNIVDSFKNRDIYYYSGYVKSFQVHGDGTPILFYFENDTTRAMNVVMKRDITIKNLNNNNANAKEVNISDTLYDIATPYGYGGFLIEGEDMKALSQEYKKCCKENDIISEFVRFHPQLRNSDRMKKMYDVIDLSPTITMDLESHDIILQNMSSKNRNMIRKAFKEGVSIYSGNSIDLFKEFMIMYNKTMEHNNATDYYYFNWEFYTSLINNLSNNLQIYYAKFDDKIISMAIILFCNNKIHYHLSASDFDYRNKAANNLLLYEVACQGSKMGFKTFHLGGGVGSNEDSLYKFKRSFNINSETYYSIGKKIFDKDKYNYLVGLRKKEDDFNEDSSFFPLYRA